MEYLNEFIKHALASGDEDLIRAAYKLSTDPYYNFRPRPDRPEELDQQTSFVNDRHKGIACVIAGNRAGKSASSAYKVATFVRETPPPDTVTRFWVVCQTMEMASGICWAQHLSKFLPDAKIVSYHSAKLGWPKAVTVAHANGNSWLIEFKSYDQGREALQGAAIAGWWCDEQIDHSLLTEIDARSSNYSYSGNKLYSLTPLRPDPQLEKIYAEQEKNPSWKFYRMNTRLNSTIDPSFLETCLDEQRETRTVGAFANFSGAVYKSFGSAHVIEPMELPKQWQRVSGIDFGFDHPTCAVFAAKDLAGRWYVYDEYSQSKNSLEEHITAIKEKWPGPEFGTMYADHAAAQDRHEFSLRGLPTYPADKSVNAGIAKIQQLLRPGVDGKPGLLIFKTCEKLISQMRTYSWHPNIPNKVNKKDDDLPDALRYMVMSEGSELKAIPGMKLDNTKRFSVGPR